MNHLENLKLKPEQLRLVCQPEECPCTSTREITPLEGVIGQDRAMRAIDLGLNIQKFGFNIYVSGLPGTGRSTSVDRAVVELAARLPVPDDWCYVYNFAEPDRPNALRLPPGKGREFRRDLKNLLEELKLEVPRSFESKEYEEQRNEIMHYLQEARQKALNALQEKVAGEGFTLKQTPTGLVLLPSQDGKPLSDAEYEKLGPTEKDFFRQKQEKLRHDVSAMIRQVRDLEKEAKELVHKLDLDTGNYLLNHHFQELLQKYAELPEVAAHLDQVRQQLLDHIHDFMEKEEAEVVPGLKLPTQPPSFLPYQVNLLVDNSQAQGAPVVWESNPTYFNLVGRQEYRPHLGSFLTDFTLIKAGALHRANGGFLILQANDLFYNYFSWAALKRCLKNRAIRIEDLAEQFHLISTTVSRPEPIPLETKLVLIGNPYIYQMLFAWDEDFSRLFKVKADFDHRIERNPGGIKQYAAFVSRHCREKNLLPFDCSALGKIVEYGSRLVADQKRLSSQFASIVAILEEADYWARQTSAARVGGAEVRRAIEERVYRNNRIEERLREMVADGQILIDDRGAVVGQINGLAVLTLGDYAFGRPSRITVRTFVGKEGILDIERETKMSGPIHTKGVLILSGFLGERYAHTEPLTLSASVCFEQSYEEIDGDSASSTELYALLSSLAELPIRQDIAVTGSVNQKGEVQAIGGVNEKIEGFFEVCKLRGLTGEQGVIIPRANIQNLMLKEEVVEAAAAGRFHVWAVSQIDEGIEILTGVATGQRQPDGSYPPDTVNGRVARKFQKLNSYYTLSQRPRRSGRKPADRKRARIKK
ncbi:MAG: Lon protease [candidate division TA06 bacterium ADurb.Bin417]|uniref:endopeptidase La n=1 Tax=candidate division TA06 bacterium ADurb.Bin417 TaxID=1852828 RepID=A0A1V5MJB7_UNCT6|nr:MAG: Lon protease [candidate division TA06 bacterium ADurb.Bin417]